MIDEATTSYCNSQKAHQFNGYMQTLYNKADESIQLAINNHMTRCVVKDYFYKKIKEEQKVCIKNMIDLLESKGYSVKYDEENEYPKQDYTVWQDIYWYTYFVLNINFKPNIFVRIYLFFKTLFA